MAAMDCIQPPEKDLQPIICKKNAIAALKRGKYAIADNI